MRAHWVSNAYYLAAERLRDECLVADGSLFRPGEAVWTPAVAEEWDQAISEYDTSSRSFWEKLADQIRPLSPPARQLAAESTYVVLLPEADTGGDSIRGNLQQHVLPLLDGVTVPPELAAALDKGIATYGQGGRNKRDAHLRYLVTFTRELKKRSVDERRDLLTDAAACRAFAHALPHRSGQLQRAALLHLLFPDVYEPIVSDSVKERIVSAFSGIVAPEANNPDEALASIREALSEEYGPKFSFYDDDLRAQWDVETRRTTNRAWFLRGGNDRGVNRVPTWIAERYISIGWDDTQHVRPGMSIVELQAALRRAVPDHANARIRMGAGNMDRFLHQMSLDDLVVTVDGSSVYAGRITGEPTLRDTPAAGAAWRREVEWLNASEPFDRTSLPEPLQTSLKTQLTLSDLTKHLPILEELLEGDRDELAYWAARLYETPTFDATERDYKLDVAARLSEARARLDEPDWLDSLRRAFAGKNNLTSFHEHAPFLRWCEDEPEAARRFLRSVWDGDAESVMRGSLFEIPASVIRGRAARVTLGSFLLLAVDPTAYPVFRNAVYTKVSELAAHSVVPAEALADELYADYVVLLDELAGRLRASGTEVRDRLDTQSLAWWLAQGPPPEDWSEEDRMAFRRWSGELVYGGDDRDAADSSAQVRIDAVTDALAGKLFVTREWLQEIVDLLNEKRQAIFYGPPGTGKTYVAQRVGEHVVGMGGTVRLVQFHPAYSYEDFFEGYRPTGTDGAGSVRFDLRPGPLRELADEARRKPDVPHLLIVDEINRGNIAKIFGELYFLLEYRDRAIRLQYSAEEFALPDNLFVIGTMNTADRSIALVDSALRRRFYFVGFMPREEPLRGVLGRWLRDRGYDEEPAALLAELNAALASEGGADDEFAIGPSYFMTRGVPDVDLVWRHAIAPLLEERFYGAMRPQEISARFGPEALRRRLAGASAEADLEDELAE